MRILKANEGVSSLLKRLDVLEKRLKLANKETKKLKKEKAELQGQYERDRSMMKSKVAIEKHNALLSRFDYSLNLLYKKKTRVY